MANNPKPAFPIEIVLVIAATLAAICITLTMVAPELLPQLVEPTPIEISPTSIPTGEYQPEVIPVPTDTPDLASTSTLTIPPTNTRVPTLTPSLTPTTFSEGPLPDLTVTGISNPICTQNHIGTRTGKFLNFTVYIRNIGRVPTRPFGPFDVEISLIIGQTYYSLAEWADEFNGVVGSSNLTISNLNPNAGISLKLEFDLIGNRQFGIQVIANSGANTIPEANTTNNALIEYFSISCY